MKQESIDIEKKFEEIWGKLHTLDCDLSYFLDERNSTPEPVKCKHAWDMILKHLLREVVDAKGMVYKLQKEIVEREEQK